MIFKHMSSAPFVYQNEGCKSYYLETKSDYLVGKEPYEWRVFLRLGSIVMLAPTVIDRWDDE